MKKTTLGLSMLAMAGALAVAGSAIAAGDAPMEPGATMTRAPMTRADAKTRAETAFDKLDVNHDGKLDKADRTARISAHFDKMDANHDGQISRDEFIAAHEKMQAMMGHGGAGKMGAGEMGSGAMGMGHMDHEGLAQPKAGMRMMQGARMGMLGAILQKADPQHTGTVTKDAFVAAALGMFDETDTNHDGKVTPDERKAAFRKKMGEMRGHMGGRMHHQHGDMPAPNADI